MFKKVVSIALAALMTIGSAAIVASAVEADDEAVLAADDSSAVGADSSVVGADSSDTAGADSSDAVSAGANSIWFHVNPEVFKSYVTFFCYIYRSDGKDVLNGSGKKLNQWGARACMMDDAGDGYYFFDLDANGVTIESGVSYICIFASGVTKTTWGAQTCDIIVGPPVYGKDHAAWCDGSKVENSADSNKESFVVAWTGSGVDTEKYAPPLIITSIGNIIGSAIPEGQTRYSIFVNFLADQGTAGLINAMNYANGKTQQQVIDGVATDSRFNLGQDDVAAAIKEAQARLDAAGNAFKIEWKATESKASTGSTVSDADKSAANKETGSDSSSDNKTSNNNNGGTTGNGGSTGGTTGRSTGGTGSSSVTSGQETTIFFVFGGVMLAAAGVIFLARKRRDY